MNNEKFTENFPPASVSTQRSVIFEKAPLCLRERSFSSRGGLIRPSDPPSPNCSTKRTHRDTGWPWFVTTCPRWTSLQEEGTCVAVCSGAPCWLARYLLMLVWWSCGLYTNMSSCRGVVTPFVGHKQSGSSVSVACHGAVGYLTFYQMRLSRHSRNTGALPAPAEASSSGCFGGPHFSYVTASYFTRPRNVQREHSRPD